ncbi:MAG: ABC transporter substrate-binding protein [bacterium]|nr:MAG: ABC transporter substrate-binding protein [bacterium]
MKTRFNSALTCAAIAALCLISSGSAAADGGTFRFPLFYVPSSLDPVKEELVDTYHIVQQVYDGLVAFDRNLRVVPGLAENWTVSRDGMQYVFTLRKGVRFHDGREVTARDVVASLSRLFDKENRTSSKEFLYRIKGAREFREGKAKGISGIRALSDTRVAVELVEPYAPFLSALAMPITKIVPEGMILDPERPLDSHPVGTGPFRFHSWKEGTVLLTANRDYFGGAPRLDEIRFVFYPGEERERAFPDFLKGDLSGCPLPGNADLSRLRTEGYQVLVRPRISLLFYGLNLRKPPLDDPDLRKAVLLAIDRETLSREVMASKYPPAMQIIPQGTPGYSPENALAVLDARRAAEHLANSRYPGGKGLRELTLASASHSDLAKKELEMVRQDLARLGIPVKPVFVESWEEFRKGIAEGRYDMYRYAIYADIPDPDDLLPGIVETGGSHNFTGYGNPEVDDLIKRARGETDAIKRTSLYRAAERKVLDDAPLVPVIFLSTQVAFQKNVRNIELPATGTPYLPLMRVTLGTAP